MAPSILGKFNIVNCGIAIFWPLYNNLRPPSAPPGIFAWRRPWARSLTFWQVVLQPGTPKRPAPTDMLPSLWCRSLSRCWGQESVHPFLVKVRPWARKFLCPNKAVQLASQIKNCCAPITFKIFPHQAGAFCAQRVIRPCVHPEPAKYSAHRAPSLHVPPIAVSEP